MTLKTLELPIPEQVPAELLLRHSVPACGWQLATPEPVLRAWGMSPYRPTRREFLIGAGSLLVLAPYGCSGESGQGGETTSSGTRTVEYAGGTTEVPENPQRVVVLGELLVGHLVSVDLTPVAASESGPEWVIPYRERFDEDLRISEIRSVGTAEEPNLEQIAAIGPDLILHETFLDEGTRDRLAEIAPTVVIFLGELEDYSPGDTGSVAAWKPAFDQTVRAVGRQEEAEQWRQRYQDALAQAREVSEGVNISFIRPDDSGTFRLEGTGTFPGSVAEEAGFTVTDAPEGVGEVSQTGYVTISGERLDVAGGDLIVTPDYRDLGVDETAVETFESNPLWETLPAVEAGRVLSLPGQIYGGGTYAYATALLNELRQAVAGGGETTGGGTTS